MSSDQAKKQDIFDHILELQKVAQRLLWHTRPKKGGTSSDFLEICWLAKLGRPKDPLRHGTHY